MECGWPATADSNNWSYPIPQLAFMVVPMCQPRHKKIVMSDFGMTNPLPSNRSQGPRGTSHGHVFIYFSLLRDLPGYLSQSLLADRIRWRMV